jgi:hypothetical protein
MIQLNEIQAESLRGVFELIFDENTVYLDFVPIDEIYSYLIGGETDEHFDDRLSQTAFLDSNNLGMMILIGEWMDAIEGESVTLEYFELASNAIEFKKQINQIIKEV